MTAALFLELDSKPLRDSEVLGYGRTGVGTYPSRFPWGTPEVSTRTCNSIWKLLSTNKVSIVVISCPQKSRTTVLYPVSGFIKVPLTSLV
ncbi:hypothetical protein BDV59DRAFT_167544 [Aspergillus ambiguus]|uniref:uncharacterized protein n=1 Tax=Aspergillus ambiguus TaxID=176160 RepID=UPI003CCE39D7